MARTDPRPHYGEKRRVTSAGYVDLFMPDHPLARKDGYVFEHRVVLYESGVPIAAGFQAHHLNGDKADNRLENLVLVSAGDHARLHWDERRPEECPKGHAFTEENTAFNPSGWRYCKQCNRDKVARYRMRSRRTPAYTDRDGKQVFFGG